VHPLRPRPQLEDPPRLLRQQLADRHLARGLVTGPAAEQDAPQVPQQGAGADEPAALLAAPLGLLSGPNGRPRLGCGATASIGPKPGTQPSPPTGIDDNRSGGRRRQTRHRSRRRPAGRRGTGHAWGPFRSRRRSPVPPFGARAPSAGPVAGCNRSRHLGSGQQPHQPGWGPWPLSCVGAPRPSGQVRTCSSTRSPNPPTNTTARTGLHPRR
jgi:hypothetical protein